MVETIAFQVQGHWNVTNKKTLSASIFTGKTIRPGQWPNQWHDWQWQFKNRLHSLPQLAAWLALPPDRLRRLRPVVNAYPLSITPYYLSLIDGNDDHDPIRRQCFPDLQEIRFSLGGEADPLAEHEQMPVPGLVHRYADRCLILTTHVCSVYCRHCNRKRLWGQKPAAPTSNYYPAMMAYIAQTPSIREVILSGGDPLILSDETLDRLLASLRAIPHVEVIRIGSRVPAVLPMRITEDLCRILRRYRPLWLNTQFNHPREITPESGTACDRLVSAGIPVSNQSVLLKGVNDNEGVMGALLYKLQEISVRPYYLFQCDPVAGTDHFRVDIPKGMAIMESLWSTHSGLCLPRYVLDIPGAKGKIPLQPFSLQSAPCLPKP
ncbi:MAG: L-lysine 2,3-aminomutase [Syntrophus sp. SKADARSKE-3]|nr:L-lysine 2,3-aminomutase [Syntrophus sp. SKADARSKE-3]